MICVDASVVVKWLFVEEHSVEARGLLRSAMDTAEPIIAPPLLLSEVANVIRQYQRRGELNLEQARAIVDELLAFPITILSPETLYDRALILAHEYDLPAIYDAQYVALAELLAAALWTADRRLARSVGGGLPFVHVLANWRPAEDNE